jgi:hypothetical protein
MRSSEAHMPGLYGKYPQYYHRQIQYSGEKQQKRNNGDPKWAGSMSLHPTSSLACLTTTAGLVGFKPIAIGKQLVCHFRRKST